METYQLSLLNIEEQLHLASSVKRPVGSLVEGSGRSVASLGSEIAAPRFIPRS